ncbi:MAG TPA: GvpL/GvpF family gas vesicle protein [Pyrinomonadaceae bacterium]|nr:GvpL/GvpF family gas vesicle protein [Pyrinomonadaceae bacterium]
MTESKPKKSPRTSADQGRAYYLYCIGEQEALASVYGKEMPPPIEPDTRFVKIDATGLSAVTSLVPLADYGEDALQSRMTDATWVAVRAMRHEKVVEHFASRASVVPLRFGTIYLEGENVELMMDERRDELLAIIERLRGREEWGINVYSDRAKLMEAIVSLSPRLSELSEQAARVSPGQSYLMRKKIDSLREAEARAETRRAAVAIERELLNGAADASARLRVLKDEAAEQGEVAARLAFLVERERFNEFRAVAERLAREYEGAGFKLELTGPWPAYNFAAGGRE